jgi:hypothetical protein
MQWLAASGLVAYPTNLLSRFYGAPLVGAKIQKMLTDVRYNFRDEILDFNSPQNYSSQNGKTRGALSPNEFWYFWRRFLFFDAIDYAPEKVLREDHDLRGLAEELNALANIFEKPFALKAMIMNQNIPALAGHFNRPLFIWVKRDPIFTIQSVLEARKRQYGSVGPWYSFKIREFPHLQGLQPLESVAGQIAAINRSIEMGLSRLPADQYLIVPYESFCPQPTHYLNELRKRLKVSSTLDNSSSNVNFSKEVFHNSNTWRLQDFSFRQASEAYERAQLDGEY